MTVVSPGSTDCPSALWGLYPHPEAGASPVCLLDQLCVRYPRSPADLFAAPNLHNREGTVFYLRYNLRT